MVWKGGQQVKKKEDLIALLIQFIFHFFGFDKGETGGKRELHNHSKNDTAIEDPTKTETIGPKMAEDSTLSTPWASLHTHCIPLVCFISVPQLLPTLCNPMDCSTPGFPAHQQLPELTQTHVHQVFDAIQPSHPPAFNLSQHQGLF